VVCERDWVKGPKSVSGCGVGDSEDNDVVEDDGDIMRSEDGHAAIVAELPDGEEGVGLEIGADVGTSRGDRKTVDGENTCVTDDDGGAIWQVDGDLGRGRGRGPGDVFHIVLHFEEGAGGTIVYNGRRRGGVCGIHCITFAS
jgi:hypothetical protein